MKRQLPHIETDYELLDDRRVSLTRLILAASALLVIFIDPSEPDRNVIVTYVTLALYTGYSLIILILAIRRGPFGTGSVQLLSWLDLLWYVVLISLSSGTSSIFFYFFFLPILVASFRLGFVAGVVMINFAALAFCLVGYLAAPPGPDFELNRFLLRLSYLLFLGYLIASWGGVDLRLRRQMTLLQALGQLANPRLGEQQVVVSVLERLRAYYGADSCLLLLTDATQHEYRFYKSDQAQKEGQQQTIFTAAEALSPLLQLPADSALIYGVQKFWQNRDYCEAWLLTNNELLTELEKVGAEMADWLQARSLLTMSIQAHHQINGRFFMTATTARYFRRSEVAFLQQVFKQVLPVLESIRLTEHIANDAAAAERRRLARDIHDSVIQPYLGLQIGLNTVRQNLAAAAESEQVTAESLHQVVHRMLARLKQLSEMTEMGIVELRQSVKGLRGKSRQEADLLSAIRRYTAIFTDITGIQVELEAELTGALREQLENEVFQMMVEGLSNVRRHSQARQARIRLSNASGSLTLQIENESESNSQARPFVPRSIQERAESLQGTVRIELSDKTIVTVIIPA